MPLGQHINNHPPAARDAMQHRNTLFIRCRFTQTKIATHFRIFENFVFVIANFECGRDGLPNVPVAGRFACNILHAYYFNTCAGVNAKDVHAGQQSAQLILALVIADGKIFVLRSANYFDTCQR